MKLITGLGNPPPEPTSRAGWLTRIAAALRTVRDRIELTR